MWSGGPPRIDTVISQVSDPHRLSPYQGAAVVRYQCCRLTVVLQPPPTMQQLPRRPSLRSYVSCDSDFDFHSELFVVIYDLGTVTKVHLGLLVLGFAFSLL